MIISGPEEAPPLVLLHASVMASWSWLYNIEGLNHYFRTYAIDQIGDAGRSMLADINHFPQTGTDLITLNNELMDSLGVQKASYIGASQGGSIATYIALHTPKRVNKLILSGPMGYTGTHYTVMRILFTTLFPFKTMQESALRWAFSDDPFIPDVTEEWFIIIVKGVVPRSVQPVPFTTEQLQSLHMPVLFLFGTKYGLVGNPKKAREHVQVIPNVQVEILEAGHLISAEKPEQFNRLILEFLGVDNLE
ncbi:alpha/beta hydrolase [candidate division KSB1 bacterium]|nr:alpha/beta hydrolase [candidate division KSB1 bacterium]